MDVFWNWMKSTTFFQSEFLRHRKCDNDPLQPDFVTAEAVSDLYDMILDLMAELGCE